MQDEMDDSEVRVFRSAKAVASNVALELWCSAGGEEACAEGGAAEQSWPWGGASGFSGIRTKSWF